MAMKKGDPVTSMAMKNHLKEDVYPRVLLKRLSESITHPFQCTGCQKRFHKVYEATEHYTNSHKIFCDSFGKPSKEEKIPCTICSKNFDRTNMKRHILTVHKGVKPFKCTLCVTNFSTKTHLKRHIAGIVGRLCR